MNRRNKKMLALGISAAMLMPAYAGTVEAATPEEDISSMQEEISSLTARLTELEKSLNEAKAKQDKQEKAEKKKKEAPTLKWSGSTKTGYMYDESKTGKIKAEVKLRANTTIDNTYDLGFGLKFKSTSNEPNDGKYSQEKNRVKLEQAWIGRSFGPVYVKAGAQPVAVGEGLWLSKGSVNAFTANYKMTPRDNFYIGYGRDAQDYLAEGGNADPNGRSRVLTFLQYQHDFSKDAFAGLYMGRQQPERYWGLYGETPIVGKLGFFGEYIVNTNEGKPEQEYETVYDPKIKGDNISYSKWTEKNGYGYKYHNGSDVTRGYLLGLNYGKAKKKGTWGAKVQYLNVDQNLFMDSHYTDLDDQITQDGYLGWALILDYATSDHTKLSLERYWGHTKPDGAFTDDKGRTLEESPYYTTYLKFTSKF